jgi:hypothetical protein
MTPNQQPSWRTKLAYPGVPHYVLAYSPDLSFESNDNINTCLLMQVASGRSHLSISGGMMRLPTRSSKCLSQVCDACRQIGNYAIIDTQTWYYIYHHSKRTSACLVVQTKDNILNPDAPSRPMLDEMDRCCGRERGKRKVSMCTDTLTRPGGLTSSAAPRLRMFICVLVDPSHLWQVRNLR